MRGAELQAFLSHWSGDSEFRRDVAATLLALARSALQIRGLVAAGPLNNLSGRDAQPLENGDVETVVDAAAMRLIAEALKDAPVAALMGEQMDRPLGLGADKRLLVAADPLDGSINIDTNSAIGTIFSLLPRPSGDVDSASCEAFYQAGEKQVAAGFVVYGPRTSLVLTLREGAHVFTRDPADDKFYLTTASARIPTMARDYAINASNYRHWDEATRTYVDDCLKGAEGVRAFDFNMRWIGSLVAEIYRMLSRGGIYLYPADRREGHAQGRLRLLFEANPIALIVENAGGAASTGRERILAIQPKSLHQRVPIVVGSRAEVDYVMRLYSQPHAVGERSPLFGSRGLFRV